MKKFFFRFRSLILTAMVFTSAVYSHVPRLST